MNLSTTYLGLKLRTPLIIGASPFCENIEDASKLEEAGASAIVMRSLFEEQIDLEQQALFRHLETPAESNPEATSYFPHYDEYQLSPETYVNKLERLKSALSIPVIASLNGETIWNTPGDRTIHDHDLVVTAVDATAGIVHLNDSASPLPQSQVSIGTFEAAWATSNHAMVIAG